ncbi:MAG: hypothetical protein RSE41_06385 [Clostridia bacterium]
MNISIETKYNIGDEVNFKYFKSFLDTESFTEHDGIIEDITIEISKDETNIIYFMSYKIEEDLYSCFCNEKNIIKYAEKNIDTENVGGTTSNEVIHTTE